MTLLKLAGGVAALYIVVVALIALAQDWLLFPRWAMGHGAAALPASTERIELATPGGDVIVGVLVPGRGSATRLLQGEAQAATERPPRGGPAVLVGFGGNAWDAGSLAAMLHGLHPEHDVAAFHYRGYAPSTGRPSAAALDEDALLIHDHLVAARPGQPVVVVGLSIGAGPAAQLARQRPVAGLILVTPFDSLAALAREHYPWAPVGLLLRHRMEVAEAMAGLQAPVALIAAGRDTIVPPRRTEPLRRAAANLVLDRVIGNAGHNDLYSRQEFAAAMREALTLVLAGGGGGVVDDSGTIAAD